MKKTTVILASVLTAGIFLVPAAFYSMAAGSSEAAAEKAALEHAGVEESQVAFIRTETEYEKGRLVFDVEFYTTDHREYDYEIDAETGKILSWDYDCEFLDGTESRKQGTYQAAPAAAQTDPGKVSEEEAVKTALAFAGAGENEVLYSRTETDYENGRQVYEIEFLTDSQVKYEFTVDTESGEIVSYEFEDKSGYGAQREGERIGVSEAQKIAAAGAGLETSEVTFLEMGLENEDGRLLYEGEFVCGDGKYEFEIDGITGQIVKWEK